MSTHPRSAVSRRKFIRQSALTAGGFLILPRHVLGRGFIAPSDKLNIAGIGVGGKGFGDLMEFAKSPYVNIVSLCDVDDRQAKDARKNIQKQPITEISVRCSKRKRTTSMPVRSPRPITRTQWLRSPPCN